MPNCPKCGSDRFHYELRSGGTKSTTRYYSTGVKKSWVIPSGRRTYSSNRKQESIGICPDCGYTDKQSQGGIGCLTGIVIILVLAIISAASGNRNADNPKSDKASATAAVTSLQSNNHQTVRHQTTEPPTAESVWATEYTPISDFEYYIDHNKIILEEYRGKEKKVYVAPAYEVDGIMMDVVELEGVFALNRIDSAIISHGIKKMQSNIFNSCGIKYIFLPSSLEEFDGWNYFHNAERLYYEGSEEEFNSICNEERKYIDITRIIFDTPLNDLISQ